MTQDHSRYSRRQFLRSALIAAGTLAISSCLPRQSSPAQPVATQAADQPPLDPVEPSNTASAPVEQASPSASPPATATAAPAAAPTTVDRPVDSHPRVVHMRAVNATHWNGSETPAFYASIDQDTVSDMVRKGLASLSGQSAAADIWAAIFTRVRPEGYQRGQKIAIKVNFNNSDREPNNSSRHDNNIDALPQPIVGLLDTLIEAGVDPADVVCYDATGSEGGGEAGRTIPAYFREGIASAYPAVGFVGKAGSGVTAAAHGKDPSLTVPFNAPGGGMKDRLLADVLYDAAYLINMPLLKCHSGNENTPVTLSFKNHCGSINYVYASQSADSLHTYITVGGPEYSPDYSPLVDLYNSPHIKGKTILTLGDGLFGAMWGTSAELSWSTFGGPANSLLFSFDPVAIDCVMADLLRAESLARGSGGFTTPRAYDTMFIAQKAGLGICEGTPDNPSGNPWQTPYGSGYASVEYFRQDL